MYKIFGAVAIIGLFLLSSVASTLEPAAAIFFPDLIPWSVNVEVSILRKTMVLGIKNDGRSMLFYNFNTHGEIEKLGANVHVDYTCRGIIWLRGAIKYFSVTVPRTLCLDHDVKINVDDKQQIFEGIGEINNNQEFDDVYFGPLP